MLYDIHKKIFTWQYCCCVVFSEKKRGKKSCHKMLNCHLSMVLQLVELAACNTFIRNMGSTKKDSNTNKQT